MPRVTVTVPNDLYKKLVKYAGDNDDSLSYTITKMTEIGLMVTESQQNQKSPEDKYSDIEKHCFKLMIQMNALLKNMASKQLDYGQDEFKKLMDLSINKYQELMGIDRVGGALRSPSSHTTVRAMSRTAVSTKCLTP